MKHNFNYKNDGPLNRYFADGANDDVINNPKSLYVLDLFSGTGSCSKIAHERGHAILSYDSSPTSSEIKKGTHNIVDILNPDLRLDGCSLLWASPPCQKFSVASIGKYWTKPIKCYFGEAPQPKTEEVEHHLHMLERTIEHISIMYTMVRESEFYWIIENPRGMMRKVIEPIFKDYSIHDFTRHTIAYCQYGDKYRRQKPTDLWTNIPKRVWTPRPMCKPIRKDRPETLKQNCHDPAPRGSATGTQGVKGNRERSTIPRDLFVEIFEAIEGRI
tara:strand:- start:2598 stop:3416 length:819 start_codon:yes stop_codon:yes gene_type:complete